LKEFLVFEFESLDGKFGIFEELKFLFFGLLKLEFDALTVESKLLLNLEIREKILQYVF
jgi:hypothetical protein